MFTQRTSQNIFGLKTVQGDNISNSLTSVTDVAARDLTSLQNLVNFNRLLTR